MTIIRICSKSKIKVTAVQDAFTNFGFKDFTVHGEDSPSGVPDQPIGDQTAAGAHNRANFLKEKYPSDVIVSIENGLFPREDGHFDDKAVVVILTPDGRSFEGSSGSVKIDKVYVEEAVRRNITAGKVMVEKGIVKDHADPHADLSGKPRATFLREAIEAVVAQAFGPRTPMPGVIGEQTRPA